MVPTSGPIRITRLSLLAVLNIVKPPAIWTTTSYHFEVSTEIYLSLSTQKPAKACDLVHVLAGHSPRGLDGPVDCTMSPLALITDFLASRAFSRE